MIFIFLLISLAFGEASDIKKLVERFEKHEKVQAKYNPLGIKKSDFGDVFDKEEIMEELSRFDETEVMNERADQWKCGLEEGWEERINSWYKYAAENQTDHILWNGYLSTLLKNADFDKERCINALRAFDDDLHGDDWINGALNPAKIMCSSWGYKGGELNQPQNFLKKYSTSEYANFATKTTQCYFAKRYDKSGNLLYSGEYAHEASFGALEAMRNIIALGAEDYMNCSSECTEKGIELGLNATSDEVSNCPSTNCGLRLSTGKLGLCYPAQCTPIEILLARKNIRDAKFDEIFMTNQGNYHENMFFDKEETPWVNRASEVAWIKMAAGITRIVKYVEPIYRVPKGTMIASAVVFCSYAAFLLVVSFFPASKFRALKAFHVPTNYLSMVDISRPAKAIRCIDGIRVMSIWWVLMGHILTQLFSLEENLSEVSLRLRENSFMRSLANALPSVDSFFLMGGLLMAYLGTEKTIKASKRPLGFVIAFSFNIINRWMRLVPVILLGIWLQVAILPLFGQGLGQITSNIMGAACIADNMFAKTIFFVMAFYDEGAVCLGQVWYLGCEFWYAAIFPLNAALYGVHKALGVTFTVLLSIGSISWCWYQSIIHNTTPYQQLRLPPVTEQDMANDTYMRPWARYDAYGVGILFGWLILAERKGNGFKNFVKKNKIVGYMVVIALWFVSLFLLYFTIFGFSGWCFLVDFENLWDKRIDLYYESLDPTSSIKWDYITGCSSTNDSSAAWNALHRAVWAFALGLLIFLCDSGFGFTINSFLSFTGWNIFAKTSFAFYIVHYSMIVVQQQSEQTMIIVDEYWITWTFIHLMTLTTAIAALIYISFELPMAKLWGIVFGFLQGLTAPRQQTKTGAEKKEELSEDLEKNDDDNVSSEVDEELEMSMQKVEKM